MSWRLDTSRNAEKFLAKNELTITEVRELIGKAIRYFQGEDINVDIKKLKGEWRGFYRIRSGRIRIIAEFNFENSVVFIEEIDWRGNAYK
ncbi:MAG: plasmid stabilization system protein [Parcubacteria group bacterium Greene0714_21]|nr:MAG: plasmid stabilization system protein [Parcubacteria group bacterium Greene0416_39]TSC97881.1 MAG: plasmid stabilization system protein [Parcubacteria group bacterium Greene1014_47]TSD03912.1 MAG: plasmid stabilization system protein [Parcubacteria group bacterium Greene0714_21]